MDQPSRQGPDLARGQGTGAFHKRRNLLRPMVLGSKLTRWGISKYSAGDPRLLTAEKSSAKPVE